MKAKQALHALVLHAALAGSRQLREHPKGAQSHGVPNHVLVALQRGHKRVVGRCGRR
jgi:hypothetical protein